MTSICVYGVPFDPDVEPARLAERRRRAMSGGQAGPSPYEALTTGRDDLVRLGEAPVEPWLSPFPQDADAFWLTPERLGAFVAEGGCRAMASRLESWLRRRLPEDGVPAMIGVDHSTTAAAVRLLSEHYGADLAVLVIDAHLDAVPQDIRNGLADYARETGELEGPDLRAFPEPDAFHCGTFLYHLVNEGTLGGNQLAVVGVAPEPTLDRSDPRIDRYARFRAEWDASGARTVLRSELDWNLGRAVDGLVEAGRPLYISFDLDVAAADERAGVRYPDPGALSGRDVDRLLAQLTQLISQRGARLAGFDLVEFDCGREPEPSSWRLAGRVLDELRAAAGSPCLTPVAIGGGT